MLDAEIHVVEQLLRLQEDEEFEIRRAWADVEFYWGVARS